MWGYLQDEQGSDQSASAQTTRNVADTSGNGSGDEANLTGRSASVWGRRGTGRGGERGAGRLREGGEVSVGVGGAAVGDGRTGSDTGGAGERMVAAEPHLAGSAAREIDVEGLLVSPPFVDAHFHMDSTLSLGMPRLNRY